MVAVTAIVTALALAAHRGPAYATLMAAAVLTGQLFVGWTNDIVDAAEDRRQGRTDKPLASGQVSEKTVRRVGYAALALTVPLSLATGLVSGLAHLTAVAAATAYNNRLKRTALSVVPYAVAFGLVPAFITGGPPITHAPPLWATAAAALLGAGAHFTQTLTGLEGLPKRIGKTATTFAGPVLMVAAAAVIAAGPAHAYLGLAVAAITCIGVVGAAATKHPKLAFRLALLTAAAVVATVVASGARF